jgi:hypothetical protein
MKKSKVILVKGISIATFKKGEDDFIYLTDIARNKNAEEPNDVVKNWMRFRTTFEFWVFGSSSIFLISKGSNSMPFYLKQAPIRLHFHLPIGLKLPMLKGLCLNKEIMSALLPTKILHLNLHLGLVRDLNFI